VRVGGQNRYETAVDSAKKLGNPKAIFLGTWLNFPDALTAVGQLGQLDAPILLTRPSRLVTPTKDYLSLVKASLKMVDVYGQTAAVSDSVANAAQAATQ
jgi:putative cell wall-binding protein